MTTFDHAIAILAGACLAATVFPALQRPTWWRLQWYRLVILKCDVKIAFLMMLYPFAVACDSLFDELSQ